MKKIKTILVGSAVLAFSFSVSASNNFPSAKINMVDYNRLNQSTAITNDTINKFQLDMQQCNQDESCTAQASYSFYEPAFISQKFSQFKTAAAYKKWLVLAQNSTPTRATLQISQSWGKPLMATFQCVKNEKCSAWLINEKGVSSAEIKAFKSIK